MVVNQAIQISGCAALTPIGDDLQSTWAALLDGRSGLVNVPSPHPLRNTLAGPCLAPPYGEDGLPPSRRLRLLTTAAITAALTDAGLTDASVTDRWCLVLGTSFGAYLDEEDDLAAWATDVCSELGLPRPLVLSTACSSGADAIAIGRDLIRSGDADVCLAGGVDVLTEAKRLGHSALQTMSADTVRPFDAKADGMLVGEGCGLFVLESADHMSARGHVPVGEVLGCGASNDAAGLTTLDPSGRHVARAIEMALDEAAADAQSVGVVCAHATGTPMNDPAESLAYTLVFGSIDSPPLVMATKGSLGHALGAAGSIELVLTLQALRTGTAPPIHGLRNVREGMPLAASTSPAPLDSERPVGVSVSIGFGGFNTCVAVRAAS